MLLAEDPPPPPRAAQGALLGWIWFRGSEPGGDIVLSVNGARDLVSRGEAGDRSLAALPGLGDREAAAGQRWGGRWLTESDTSCCGTARMLDAD